MFLQQRNTLPEIVKGKERKGRDLWKRCQFLNHPSSAKFVGRSRRQSQNDATYRGRSVPTTDWLLFLD